MRTTLIILLCCITMTVFAQEKSQPIDTSCRKIGAPMPMLMLGIPQWKMVDGKPSWSTNPGLNVIANKDLPKDANQFVMIFNPGCDHCMDITIMLEKNIELFKKSRIYMIASNNMMPYMANFDEGLHVYQYAPKIQMGCDYSKFIDHMFRYQTLPQINIYNHDQKLIKIFNGDITIDSLRAYIE